MNLEFNINEYVEKIQKNDFYFHTFINKENLAAGVLVLQPGESDTQEPHESDELYFILKGDGFLKIKDIDYAISENKAYYVGKNTEHFFHGNSKELVVLYFFGGPDS